MKNGLLFVLLAFLSLTSCKKKMEQESLENWKQEILEAERNFAQMAAEEGRAQ